MTSLQTYDMVNRVMSAQAHSHRFVLAKDFGGQKILASPNTFGSTQEAIQTALEVAQTDKYETEGRIITTYQRLGEATTFTLIPAADWK